MQRNNPRLKEKYIKEVIPYFLKECGFKNRLAVPSIEKVVLNTSLGKTIENSKLLPKACEIIAKITGLKPIQVKAKKSISAFKLREGMFIGCKVTLRDNIMYEFLDRLISVTFPRMRDFRGLDDKSFDGCGNYTIGLPEVNVFPEATTEEEIFGLELSIKTTTEDDNTALELLRALGFPFKKKPNIKEK